MVPTDAVDLTSCDREPIHVPGAVQAHGALAAFDPATLRATHASASMEALLGLRAEALLGCPLEKLVGAEAGLRLADALRRGEFDEHPQWVGPGPAGQDGAARAWLAHAHAGSFIIECEPDDPPGVHVPDLHTLFRRAADRLHAARTLDDYLNAAVAEVRALTGFDRVLIYHFLPDGSGRVVAEARREGLESFLDLHYPASDIPRQARELYLRSWVRQIADAQAASSALAGVAGAGALDLSYAGLRAVSPVHTEYLRNMGVRASMSISLIADGKLEGLIACHHDRPRPVTHRTRAACEFLGHVVSLQTAALRQRRDNEYRLRLRAVNEKIARAAAREENLSDALLRHQPSLLDVIDASAVVLRLGGVTSTLGLAPRAEDLQPLLEWVARRLGDAPLAIDALPGEYPAARAFADRASGVLAVGVCRTSADFVLWLRPEWVHEVKWAGDPQKPVETGPGGARLRPRTSFAQWVETVRGRSRPWDEAEVEAAQSLRLVMLDELLGRAERLAAVNRELARSNSELDSFAHAASHDLKEPLRGIAHYAEFLMEDCAGVVDDASMNRLRQVRALAARMDRLINTLLEYARVGRADLTTHDVDLGVLAREAGVHLEHVLRQRGATLSVAPDLPRVRCDPVRVAEVLQNLIVNGVKYNESPRPCVAVGWRPHASPGGPPVLWVQDDGIGIAPAHHEAVFRIFRRLPEAARLAEGTGAGLAIVRSIVQRHGGRVWIEPAPGRGSRFCFTLGPEPTEGLGAHDTPAHR